VVALGLALRLIMLSRPGLHPDEALYAGWALRIADGSDRALLGAYVDKPPFLLYLLAGLFRLASVDAAGVPSYATLVTLGRLAGLSAGLASLALVCVIARAVYGSRPGSPVPILAAALFALSPLAVRLSPSLFTDPWLVLWMLLGVWAALDRRAWLTGAACGLVYATKQQAVLLIPLVLATFFLVPAGRCGPKRVTPRRLWHLLNGFLLIFVLVVWWDSLRWQWMPSYWDRGLVAYGGVALASWAEVGSHLVGWGELLGYLFGWPLLVLGTVAGAAAGVLLVRRVPGRGGHDRGTRFDLLLLLFALGYLALHVVANLAVWDRYLLPLVPVLALLLARALDWLHGQVRAGRRATVARLALAAGLVVAAITSLSPRLPVADNRAYDGVAAVAAYVRGTQPAGTVLYHRWLGWHYGFYLHDAPLELRWWESPQDLARQATASAAGPQLVVFPSGRDTTAVKTALIDSGLALTPLLNVSHQDGSQAMTLWRIVSPPAGVTAHGP
jgi:4-amino-4-deoxy-L-arabinose transferase-like glycosyltransferase